LQVEVLVGKDKGKQGIVNYIIEVSSYFKSFGKVKIFDYWCDAGAKLGDG